MRQNFSSFFKKTVSDYFEALINLFIFFPYFFSVSTLLKTLFNPWKNLVSRKSSTGFSFDDWISRLSFNCVSGLMGFFMRSSFLIFYILLQMTYVCLVPFITILYFLLIPLLFLKSNLEKTDLEKKEHLKKVFIGNHLLKQENLIKVSNWFESYYQLHLYKLKWWKVANLFSIPPLGRDWSVGYTPNLDQFADDLTHPSYQNKITRIVDREKEISQIERILSKSNEANVVIVGEEGIGKHTIVDALAKKIYEGRTSTILAYKRILKLNLEKILNTYTDQKQRENFLETLLTEASLAKNIIIMIENLDKYIASGQDRIDLSTSIEKYGKTNLLQFIGTTTPFFFQKFVFTCDKINRIFAKIDVQEISEIEAETILMQAVPAFETRNQVIIPYETLKNVIDKSSFYLTSIPFPEKALDLLDNACVYYKSKFTSQTKPIITPEIIDIVLSEKTHIPTSITDEMRNKLVDLEKLLTQRVIGQETAILKLSAAIRRSFLLLGKRKKPLATFLFLGPTGVGKTESAKALADVFFGSEKHLIRFDMSLYQSKNDIANLIGSIEINNPGLMTKVIRNNPYAVLLLDEIEKADKDLINIFLTILDEGYFTDGFGKKVDCKNLIIIATSNAAADFIFKQLTSNENQPIDDNEQLINYLVKNHIFSPEFLNRFDGVIIYKPLTTGSFSQLASKIILKISDNIYKLYKVKIIVTQETLNNLVNQGYQPEFGARNLERTIDQELQNKIAKLILERKVKEGDSITL